MSTTPKRPRARAGRIGGAHHEANAQISLRLPEPLLKKLQEMAAERDRSVNYLVREILFQYAYARTD